METKILVCGDRKWKERYMIYSVLYAIRVNAPITIIHGDCRGADRIAGSIAKDLDYTVIAVPAKWNEYGKSAGPIRNREMIRLKPSLVLAFHDNILRSRGTKNMLTQTMKAGIDFQLYNQRQRDFESEKELKATVPQSWFT